MQTITPAEIEAAEDVVGVRLPDFYRQLLAEVGHGRDGVREIYHPATVRELYEPFFTDPADLLSRYFPFG